MEKIDKASKTTKKDLSFTLSHPNKILFPEDNISKKDVLDYYELVSDLILPYIKNRPLTLLRCPDDYRHCFYQRHYYDNTPKSLKSITIESKEKGEEYIYLNNKCGLFSLVQMGVLEIHPWACSINALEYPQWITIDLDPAPDLAWNEVVRAAWDVKRHLEQYKLKSFVKTTGGKGLHVVIPIKPEYEWAIIKNFTHAFVIAMEQRQPEKYLSSMTKSKREGKIFIDYLRNQRTATAISVYSTRARLHAPVSTPLDWDELTDNKIDTDFSIKTIIKRLENQKKDPWECFLKTKQSLNFDELF